MYALNQDRLQVPSEATLLRDDFEHLFDKGGLIIYRVFELRRRP